MVENTLDNKEFEFWFNIFKSELIYKLNIKQMTFNESENEIGDFIHYYNNVKIQEKLNWMTPIQYRNHL
ncbi:MAG: IS3 family transposase [Mycoplasmataceae bacterium]|nr:IS3 family transposase [Mycoplasmataceae bacterium]